MTRFRYPVLSGLLLICASVGLPLSSQDLPAEWFWGNPEQRAQHAELEGKPMPKLELVAWRNGEITPERMEGRIVVIDFWATWCGPCIAAIPKNNAIHEKYGEQGVIVLGICGSRNGQDRYDQVLRQHDVKYPSARDASLENAERYGVMWWPTYAVVDRNGILRGVGLASNRVEDAVKFLLEEQPADRAADAGAAETRPEPVAHAPADESATQPVEVPAEWLEGDAQTRERLDLINADNPPRLRVENWVNRNGLTRRGMEGKVVVLDFWATWCGPCINSIPKNNHLHETYRDQGMVLLGVCHEEGAERMAAVAREHGIGYPTAADINNQTIQAYRVNGFPDYYVFDRAGRLRAADVKNAHVEDVVKLLLSEPDPTQSTASARRH